MDVIKRYWKALDTASHKAIKKAAFTALAMNLVLMAAYFIVYFDVLFLGRIGDSAALQLALWPAFMVGIGAIAVYGVVLVFRAHKAIKENLFAHPAPGFRTRESWTHVDGAILLFALLGLTSIPDTIAGFALDLLLGSYPFYESSTAPGALLWTAICLIFVPIAAKRYIPTASKKLV